MKIRSSQLTQAFVKLTKSKQGCCSQDSISLVLICHVLHFFPQKSTCICLGVKNRIVQKKHSSNTFQGAFWSLLIK